jgi:Skp family chaperone for outer membrane proteins
VKKLILSATAVMFMIGLGLALGNAWGQAPAKANGAADSTPHKVGLIDMAYLFSKYKKFSMLREDLRAEIEQADGSLKGQLEKIKTLQAEMKDLAPNSPKFVASEKKITELAASAEAERKNLQRKFMREETKVYQTVYREVVDAVNKYSEIYHYTLIIRYSREDAESDDPQKVMQSLQRQVVFSRPEDDITDAVLRYLNKSVQTAEKTEKSEAAPAKTPVKRVANTSQQTPN